MYFSTPGYLYERYNNEIEHINFANIKRNRHLLFELEKCLIFIILAKCIVKRPTIMTIQIVLNLESEFILLFHQYVHMKALTPFLAGLSERAHKTSLGGVDLPKSERSKNK